MSDNMSFEDFMKDWDSSFDTSTSHKPAYVKPKKTGKFVPHGDGHGMINDLDKYLDSAKADGPQQDIVCDEYPSNVWEFLTHNGFDREVIVHLSLEFDNINNIIEKMVVVTVDGHEAVFADVQLKEVK